MRSLFFYINAPHYCAVGLNAFYFMHDELFSAQAKKCFDEDFPKTLEEDEEFLQEH